jgi:hypothetical protein
MCLLGMASLAGRKQEQRPKLMPVSAAAAVPAEAERAAVALSWPAAGTLALFAFPSAALLSLHSESYY